GGRGEARHRGRLREQRGVVPPADRGGGERGRHLASRTARETPARLASGLDLARELSGGDHGTRSASNSPHPLGAAPGTRPTTAMPSSPTVCPRSSLSTTETEPALARSWWQRSPTAPAATGASVSGSRTRVRSQGGATRRRGARLRPAKRSRSTLS